MRLSVSIRDTFNAIGYLMFKNYMMTKKIELKSLISLIYILVFVFLSQKIYAASIDQSNAIDSFTIDVARRAEQVKAAGHYPIDLKLSSQNLREVAATLLFNETSCNEKYIMHWNPKEDFPSLGLPHAIWFPRGFLINTKRFFLICGGSYIRGL